jgi:hypothetical protein
MSSNLSTAAQEVRKHGERSLKSEEELFQA